MKTLTGLLISLCLLLAVPSWAATTVRATNKNAGSSTAPAVTAPTGTTTGDLVIVVVTINGQTTLVDNNGATPFTEDLNDYQPEVAQGLTTSIFSRRIVGGDPATYTFTAGASGAWAVVAITFQNPNVTTIYDAGPTGGNHAASGSSGTSIDITTVTANAWHIAVMCPDTAANTPVTGPAGYTLVSQTTTRFLLVAYKEIASPGAVGAQTFTWAGSPAYIAASLVIKPIAVAAASTPGSLMLWGVGQ